MKKNFLQDVVPSNQKRSIRDIPLPNHKSKPSIKRDVSVKHKVEELEEEVYEKIPPIEDKLPEEQQEVYEDEYASDEDTYDNKTIYTKKPKKNMPKKIITGVIIGIILFLVFIASRTQATITIQPKKSNSQANLVIPLNENNQLITKTQISKTVTKTLDATSEQQVEKQASGRIKIINRHKETPQELVKNTRFQSPNGLIYRIRDSIVIPGYTMSGSTQVPGTLEVEVFADSAGEEYNTSNTKFTIPGFSGKEQFEKITAESVTDMTGGYIGIRKVVSEETKEQTQVAMELELKTEIEKLQNQSTEYLIVPNIETLTYGELQDKADGDKVILTLSANVEAYSLVKKDLSNFIGQNSLTDATSTDSFSVDLEKLLFLIDGETLKITGNSTITWLTDTEKLKSQIAGKKRSEVPTIVDGYRSLERAVVDISPFWKSKFPSDSSKIEVIISE